MAATDLEMDSEAVRPTEGRAATGGSPRSGDTGGMSGMASARQPALIPPMLATPDSLPPPPGRDADWGFELKWDGVRALAYICAGRLRLLSRIGHDMTR